LGEPAGLDLRYLARPGAAEIAFAHCCNTLIARPYRPRYRPVVVSKSNGGISEQAQCKNQNKRPHWNLLALQLTSPHNGIPGLSRDVHHTLCFEIDSPDA
jgi:hypothetical protein